VIELSESSSFLFEPPEEIKQEHARLEALAALYRKRERRALQMRAKLENAHAAKLVAILREYDMQWMTERQFRGMISEQKEKLEAKPGYLNFWEQRGEEEIKNKEESKNNGKANGAAADTGDAL
jgi:hypothetical protein